MPWRISTHLPWAKAKAFEPGARMRTEVIILIVYGVTFLALGLWVSRGVRTSSDFLVAGRRLGFWVLVGTLAMTELNTMSLVGFSGYGYRAGVYATMIPLMFLLTFVF